MLTGPRKPTDYRSHSTLATTEGTQRTLLESPEREVCGSGKCSKEPGASRFKKYCTVRDLWHFC